MTFIKDLKAIKNFLLYKVKKFGPYAFLKQFIFKSLEELIFFEIFNVINHWENYLL